MTEAFDTRLRILSVSTSYPRRPGDFSAHFVHALNARLVDLGHEVTVLAPHAAGPPDEQTWAGVRVVPFRSGPGVLQPGRSGDCLPGPRVW